MGSRTAEPLDSAPDSPQLRPAPTRPRDAIFTFDDVTWDAARKRGMCFSQDRLALALLDDPRIRRILICNRPRSAPVKLVKDLLRPPAKFEENGRAHLYEPLRLRRRDPVAIEALARYYASYGRRLRRAAERFGLERPVVITAQPFIAGYADLDWAGPVTLFATDDLASHPAYSRWRGGLEEAYERISQRRQRVCAVSQAIIDRIGPRGPAAVVTNGVEPDEWLRPGAPPSWLMALPGPRLLYIGTLDARLDIEAMLAVARSWPDGSVVLIGPLAERRHVAPLLAEPNVFLHSPVSRGGVARLAHAGDVCLMPHLRSPLTDAMSPLKLYEYLAGGAPVVATDLEPVRRVEGPVVRVPPGGDFVAGVRAALAAGRVTEDERRGFIERNSWERRCAEVLAMALAR